MQRSLSPQRTFILLFLLSGITLLFWAAYAEVDVIVRTEGQIIPAGKSQLVQHLEGGIVRSILVQEGEVVEAGEPLMELSDIQSRAYLDQERSKLDALRGREARLLAELNDEQEVTFPA
ncbi:MAG: secretion protein HlyD, partial [Desulfuromonas sp.]